jgi:type II secretory pathway pseudopilin PulG
MDKGSKSGFTIIEVVLFLAITGLIMSVMLVGIGNSINQERYRDASTSLLGYLQGQYNSTVNVSNTRAKNQPCTGVGTDDGRGTSDCFIVGRVLTGIKTQTDSNGTRHVIESRPVYASVDLRPSDPALIGKTDVEILRLSGLTQGSEVESYAMEWGTKLVRPTGDPAGDSTFTILIIRMPTSGIIHTYVMSSLDRTPSQVLTSTVLPAEPTVDFKACLEPAGLIKSAQALTGVRVTKNAANSGGVKFVAAGDC